LLISIAIEESRRDPESILNAILHQLARTSRGILKPVVDLYMHRMENGQLNSELTMQESLGLLAKVLDINSHARTITYINGMNEIHREIRIKLLKSLKMVVEKSKNIVKIFTTSRNSPDILRQFSIFPKIDVHPDDSASDIRRFINTQLESVVADEQLLFGKVLEC